MDNPPANTATLTQTPGHRAVYWIAGAVLAIGGALAARFLAPALGETLRAIVTSAGHLAAGAGLLVIAVGVRNRVRQANAAVQADADASVSKNSRSAGDK